MDNISDIMHMGGYALYVWPSFAVAAIVMTGMVLASLRSLRRAQRALAAVQEPVISASDET